VEIAELKTLVEKGVITAITVDTTAFDDGGKRVDGGIFSQLRQFGHHPVDFIISEVVLNEIRRHLTASISIKKERFSRDMSEACEFVEYDATELTELRRRLDALPSADELCKKKIDLFLEESAANILTADDFVKVGTLLNLYFTNKAPFQLENPKKAEFPDAIALLSVQDWAIKNDRELVVVSRDADWLSFCAASERLHSVKDLATALSLFQTTAEIVDSMVARLRTALTDESSSIFVSVRNTIENFDWHGHTSVEANSQFEFEEEEIHAEILECNFIDEPENIKITEVDDNSVSVVFNLMVEGDVTVYCSFRKWDGIDREYIPMGSGSPSTNFSLNVSVLLNMPIKTGDLTDLEWDVEPDTLHVELDEIEPDWMSGRE
jgi:hypothetical protein